MKYCVSWTLEDGKVGNIMDLEAESDFEAEQMTRKLARMFVPDKEIEEIRLAPLAFDWE